MRHERQANLPTERGQAIGEQVGRGAVAEDATVAIVPACRGALRIEPAVELHVANGDAESIELALYRQQRSRVAEGRLEVVVVDRAVVGPVPKFLERQVGV